jgi:hypothetical protein
MKHDPSMYAGFATAGALTLAPLLLTWPYIDLGVALPLPGWDFDAPLADLAALVALPLGLLLLLRSRTVPPGAWAWALFLGLGLVSALRSDALGSSLHEWLRKPVFSVVAYGLGVTGVVAGLARTNGLRALLLVAIALCAALSLFTSVGRIVAGDTLWFAAIEGITNNHKTLAVAVAPALVLAWGWRRDGWTVGVVGLGAVALLASMSRTAWIAAGLGACFYLRWDGLTLAARRGLLPVLAVVGFLGATYGPIVTQSLAQMDALRSRHSIDKRAAELFLDHPVLGAGAGANVRFEAQTFPDYRVNGVDAHGVVQKVASEYGTLGLLAWLGATLLVAAHIRARHTDGDGRWPAFVALQANLALSTESFTQTHWTIYAIVVGLAMRGRGS